MTGYTYGDLMQKTKPELIEIIKSMRSKILELQKRDDVFIPLHKLKKFFEVPRNRLGFFIKEIRTGEKIR